MVDDISPDAHLIEALAAREALESAAIAPLSGTEEEAWSRFVDWCATQGVAALPSKPDAVKRYLRTVAAPQRDQASDAIGVSHELAGHSDPTRGRV